MPNMIIKREGKRARIKQSVLQWIAERQLAPGARIPGQNELAERLGTTVVTVHKALKELEADGHIHSINGSGTFVGQTPWSRVRVKSLCLVMSGENLDRPEHNVNYWPYVQQYFSACMEACGTAWSFTVRSISSDEDPADDLRLIEGHQAVLFHYSWHPKNLIRQLLARGDVSVVLHGRPDKRFGCLSVDHDTVEETRRGARWLAEQGYRRIGFIGSREWWGELALKGMQQGLSDAGLPFSSQRVVRVGESRADGEAGAIEILRRKVPFDALMAGSDMLALGVLDALQAAGVRVPDDAAVLGHDGLDLARRHPLYLATIETPIRRVIETALAELESCKGGPTPAKHVDVVGDVLPGRTVKVKETGPDKSTGGVAIA